MAEQLLYKYALLTDADATYVTGTEITVYWDDTKTPISSSAYKVYLDGVSKSTGPILGTEGEDYILEVLGYQKCSGTTLYRWFGDDVAQGFVEFPYAGTAEIIENHYSCAAVSCDIQWSGPASVTAATDSSTGDGSFTVSATSSYTVKYTLSSDPDYTTAENTTGTFTGLYPGTYKVWAYDEKQCGVSMQVIINAQTADKGVRYRLQYQDRAGNSVRDEVLETGYTGSITDIKGEGNPATLSWPTSLSFDDKFAPIRPGTMTLNAMSQTDFAFIDLFTQDDREYKLRRQKDTGSGYATVWEGYVLPSTYSEPYVHTPYVSSITAADGLETLSDLAFADGENKIYGVLKLIKIIAFILKKLDLDLPIRVAVNMYASGMADTDSSDPLDQAYIDAECFIEDGEPLDCKEVLTRILKPFGAFVTQCDGYFWIVRYEELIASFDYRQFDKDGTQTSFGSYNPITDILISTSANRLATAFEDQILEIVPAAGKYVVNVNLNEKGNLIDGTFEKRKLNDPENNSSGFKRWSLILNGSSASFNRYTFDGISYGGFNDSSFTASSGKPYIKSPAYDFEYSAGDKIRFSIELAVDKISDITPFLIIKTKVKLGTNYLNDVGEWSASESYYRFYPSPKNGIITVEVIADAPDVEALTTESLSVEVHAHFSYYPEFGLFTTDGLTDFKALSTTSKNNGYKTNVARATTAEYIDYYELINDDDAESDPDIIRPNDFDATTNKKVWKLLKRLLYSIGGTSDVETRLVTNEYLYIKRIDVDLLPNSEEPEDQIPITTTTNSKIKEVFEADLDVIDLPIGNAYINNSKNIYNNYLRNSAGTPTKGWVRDGIAESRVIQEVYNAMVIGQYQTPSQRLSGSYISDVEIRPIDCLRITQQGSYKYFIPIGIADSNVRESIYSIDAIELKASASGGTSTTRAHDSGHDTGHS